MRIPRNKRYSYMIEPKDADLVGRATMVSIFDYLMRTAHVDAQKHKLGVYEIRKKNLAWVISRAVVEMGTVLRDMDHFQVVTWISECNRIACVRNFIILDTDGKEIGHAVTQWSMIDFKSREAVNLLNQPRIIRHLHPEYPTCGIYPKKLLSQPEYSHREDHKVVYSDLDFNGHVHNTVYLQLASELCPELLTAGKGISELRIQYKKQVKECTAVTVRRSNDESGCMLGIYAQDELCTLIRVMK